MSRKRKRTREDKSSHQSKAKLVVESKAITENIKKPKNIESVSNKPVFGNELKKPDVPKLRYTVSAKYGTLSIYSTDDYRDAVDHCDALHKVFDSDGVKVYPTPPRRLPTGKYYSVMKAGNTQPIGKFHELQQAINNCPIDYNIYDPGGDIVY